MRKIYIGFAIDMDGAYHNKINSNNTIIPENHPDFKKLTEEMNVFVSGMEKLFKYFDKYKCQNAATWFVNEPGFKTSQLYPKLLDKCTKYGEIGLHTHFDGVALGGEGRYISKNKNDWFVKGLKEPTERLREITKNHGKKCIGFKAGCHLRSDDMFDSIGELGYIYESTMVYEDTVIDPDGTSRFDDTDLKFGTLPFFIFTKNNYRLLEFPEIRPDLDKVKKHINQTIDGAPVFIRLQVHPWDVIQNNHLSSFDQVIDYCRKNGEVSFKNLQEMGDIYLNYLMDIESNIFLTKYKKLLENDTYYNDGNPRYIPGPVDINLGIKSSFWQLPETYIIKHIFENYNNTDIKIIDCFAGIGQLAIQLCKLGFQNVSFLDFDNERVEIGKKIVEEEKLKVVGICDDFYKNKDILDSKIFISCNSVNGSIDEINDPNFLKQKIIYKTILENNGIVFIDISRYGTTPQNGILFIDKLKDDFDKNYTFKYLSHNFVKISKSDKNKLEPIFSNFFQDIKLINDKNIKKNIIKDTNSKVNDYLTVLIQFLDDDISVSAGIYFTFPISYLMKYNCNLPIKKYKLQFNARANIYNENFRFKIYTGIKYETIDKDVTKEYQKYSITTEFNFNKASTYRIGFINATKNLEIYINNVDIVNI